MTANWQRFAMTDGHGSRTGANGARLRGLRGMVRAQEFAGQRKWEEMKSYRQSQPQKREPVRKPNPRKPKCYFFPVPYLVQYQLICEHSNANYNKLHRNQFDVSCRNAYRNANHDQLIKPNKFTT
jgi:hypothetical protein